MGEAGDGEHALRQGVRAPRPVRGEAFPEDGVGGDEADVPRQHLRGQSGRPLLALVEGADHRPRAEVGTDGHQRLPQPVWGQSEEDGGGLAHGFGSAPGETVGDAILLPLPGQVEVGVPGHHLGVAPRPLQGPGEGSPDRSQAQHGRRRSCAHRALTPRLAGSSGDPLLAAGVCRRFQRGGRHRGVACPSRQQLALHQVHVARRPLPEGLVRVPGDDPAQEARLLRSRRLGNSGQGDVGAERLALERNSQGLDLVPYRPPQAVQGL